MLHNNHLLIVSVWFKNANIDLIRVKNCRNAFILLILDKRDLRASCGCTNGYAHRSTQSEAKEYHTKSYGITCLQLKYRLGLGRKLL